MITRYKELSKIMIIKVQAKQSELDNEIGDLESENLRKHGILPNKNKHPTYQNLLKQKKLATAILRNIGSNC